MSSWLSTYAFGVAIGYATSWLLNEPAPRWAVIVAFSLFGLLEALEWIKRHQKRGQKKNP